MKNNLKRIGSINYGLLNLMNVKIANNGTLPKRKKKKKISKLL